jgi:hypothetical protein
MDSVSVPHATQHSDLNDAVEALQAKVGADSSAVTTSHDYKIADHASRLTTLEALGEYIDYSASVTFNNFTLGNGTVSAFYTRVNDLVHFVGTVTLGSTSSVTGSWQVNLPVNNAFAMVGHGSVHFNDSGTDIYLGTFTTGVTNAAFKSFGVTGGQISENGVNATLPFTWTTGDFLRWDLLYRAA